MTAIAQHTLPEYSRLTPSAVPVEETVLSAIFIKKEAISLIDFLQPDHFYKDAHKVIFGAMRYLANEFKPINLFSVMEALERSGQIDEVGGPSYLAELTTKVTSVENIEHGAMVICERWQRRKAIEIATIAQSAAFDITIDISETLGKASQEIEDAQDLLVATKDTGTQIDELLDFAQAHYLKGDALLGPPLFGLNETDKVLDGAAGGEVLIIGGEPGTGKSSMINTALFNCVATKTPAVFWSGEMTAKRSLSRLIGAGTSLNTRLIFKGGYHDETKFPGAVQEVNAYSDQIRDSGIEFLDGEMTFNRLCSVVSYYRKRGVKLFFFDRVELFSTAGLDARGDEAKAMFMAKIRSLAAATDSYIVVVSQLRKGVSDNFQGRPTANDLLGTGAISQSATQIIFTYNPMKYGISEDEHGNPTKGTVEVIIAKNTNGEAGLSFRHFFNPDLCLMSDEKVDTWKPGGGGSFIDITPSEQPYNPTIDASVAKTNDDEDIPF